MTKICYLLLCHKDPEAVIEQIDYLLSSGGYVVVHMDKNAPKQAHRELSQNFANNEYVRFATPVRAGWGDWSLVSATLRMINIGLNEFKDATNFYYLSGDCVPIRSHEDLLRDLKEKRQDIIETAEFFHGRWIRTGPHIERVRFYHFINERKRKWLFYLLYDVQRFLGINRQIPEGLELSIGSQWWCLRRRTLERIRVYLRARPDVIGFFKWCWIPDEIFFQSVVSTLVPAVERQNKPPTFLRFSDYGLPTVFYDDHYRFLTSQEEYFARKISPQATRLKKRLISNFKAEAIEHSVTNTGRNTIEFNVNAGRRGIRFGSRVWERGGRLPQDSRLFVVISKKWHVGKLFIERLAEATGIPNLGYTFDELGEELGKFGGFENSVTKRTSNPVTFLRTVYETRNLNEILIGMDSARYNELKTLTERGNDVRLIELENQFSPEYLDGHAERIGLMVQHSSAVQEAALHRTFLETFRHESNMIQTLDPAQFVHIRDWHNARTRADMLGKIFERRPARFLEMARATDIRD